MLFHLIMVDGKTELLKKLSFVFRREILCIFRVEYNERLVGINLKRYLGFSFPRTLQKSFLQRTPIPILDISFLLTYPLLLRLFIE